MRPPAMMETPVWLVLAVVGLFALWIGFRVVTAMGP